MSEHDFAQMPNLCDVLFEALPAMYRNIKPHLPSSKWSLSVDQRQMVKQEPNKAAWMDILRDLPYFDRAGLLMDRVRKTLPLSDIMELARELEVSPIYVADDLYWSSPGWIAANRDEVVALFRDVMAHEVKLVATVCKRREPVLEIEDLLQNPPFEIVRNMNGFDIRQEFYVLYSTEALVKAIHFETWRNGWLETLVTVNAIYELLRRSFDVASHVKSIIPDSYKPRSIFSHASKEQLLNHYAYMVERAAKDVNTEFALAQAAELRAASA